MSTLWRQASAADVQVGDRIRTAAGEELTVSQIQPAFFGREGMLAFIEDTPERWYKRPMPSDAEVEIASS